MEIKDEYVLRSGHLSVGDGHKLHWQEWGNPKAKTSVVFLHGGPGGGFSDSAKFHFDPCRHRVIFFDQRGSGHSTPTGSLVENTSQKLVEDVEKLSNHLGIEEMYLFGGSWGSTLGLLYAIAHPHRVKSMVLWGIYLGRQFENDLITAGYARYNFPEAWERFIALVPEEHRHDDTAITKYYADKLHAKSERERIKYANEWCLWESTLTSLSYDQARLEQGIQSSENNLTVALMETHYFLNNCFIPENYILDNIKAIKQIPCYVVQGRFDFCTPPISAYELSKAYGDKLTLQWVSASHRRSEPETQVALRTAVNTLFV